MEFDLFSYFPDFHYRKAVEEAGYDVDPVEDHDEFEIRTDGGGYDDLHNGSRNAKLCYWLDPDTGAALEHTGVNDERTIPFFADEQEAKEYLEHRAELDGKDKYDGLSLYQARTRKVGDAVDVLTDQSGIEDFVPDGGYDLDDDDDELVLDGGYDPKDVKTARMTKAVADPVVLQNSDFTFPEEDPIYEDIKEARLAKAVQTPLDERVEAATDPEAMYFIKTMAVDGRFGSPQAERAYRESRRRYIDKWTDEPLEELEQDPALRDPNLDDEETTMFYDLKRGIKDVQDRFFLDNGYDVLDVDVPESFWEPPVEDRLDDVLEQYKR